MLDLKTEINAVPTSNCTACPRRLRAITPQLTRVGGTFLSDALDFGFL